MKMKGFNMKKYLFTLFFIVCVYPWIVNADDNLFLYTECSEGQECIDVFHSYGKKESVHKLPALVLTKESIKSATFYILTEGRLLDIELKNEPAAKLDEITRKNKDKNFIFAYNDKIVESWNFQAPVTNGKISLFYGISPMWDNMPILKDWVEKSVTVQAKNFRIVMIITLIFLIASWSFVLLAKLKKEPAPDPI